MLRYYILIDGKQLSRNWLPKRSLATKRNYYEVLGVARDATKDEIKKAYFAKAKQCHPDLYPDNEQKKKEFQDIQEAYETLNDVKRRAQYSVNPTRYPTSGHEFHQQSQGQYRHPHPYPYGHNRTKDPFPNRSENKHPFQHWIDELERIRRGPENTEWGQHKNTRRAGFEKLLLRFALAYFIFLVIFSTLRMNVVDGTRLPEDPEQVENYIRQFRLRMAQHKRKEDDRRARAVRELVDKYETDSKEIVDKYDTSEIRDIELDRDDQRENR